MTSESDQRRVVLVDGQDNALGVEGVLASHLLPGRKHRAFTAVVFDAAGRVLLAKRAAAKLLWPGYWDATVASHPRPESSYETEGERRLTEEIGVSCPLSYCGRFDYDLTFLDVGIESEVCATLVGRLADGSELAPDANEVADVRWLSLPDLIAELESSPEPYCPWLFLALVCIARNATLVPTQLRPALAPLFNAAIETRLRAALDAHFTSGSWRMLDSA